MFELIKAHHLNIMLSLSSICGITAVFVILTGRASRKKRALFLLEVCAMILLASGRLGFLYAGDTSPRGWWAVRVYNFLDFSMVLGAISAFVLYLKAMFADRGLDYRLLRFRLADALLAIGELLIIVSQFTGMYYTFDELNQYHRGDWIVLSFAIPMAVVLILITLIAQYYPRLSKTMRLSLLLFAVGPVVASVVQLFAYGVEFANITTACTAVLLYIFDLMDVYRTADMSERAIAASEAKSEFLAQMSHEIRTPINAVLGMNEMILRESRQADGGGEGAREALRNISVYAADVESAGSSLLAIINDILDFSKIEAGRMELVTAPYQLSSVLNDVSNMIFFKARDKGLRFLVDVDEALPDGLLGDEVRVRQILTNILNNAVKYTERGSIRLTLRGRTQDGELLLTAAVEDTGIGIKKEDLGRLFTRFERLDLKRNSTVEGTGLGLVITQRLLEMMGGSIDVQSEYGKGSVFTVSIPQKIVSTEPVGDFQKRFEQNVAQSRAYRESFRAPTARILIVDDTKMNLTVAVSLLKNTLLQIDTAAAGADAVKLAAKTAYDIILMDQRMPEMDGTEALHRIRAAENGPNRSTPVICLTADAVIGAKERYMAEGFSDYLTKPIDSQALEAMLRKYLPREKLLPVREQLEDTDNAANAQDAFAPLRRAGIDAALGLTYCQNDEGFYRSILRDYAGEAPEAEKALDSFYQRQDWKNYAIRVHALKSTSRMIGAQALSELAARLEKAANAEDAEAVRQNHAELLARYEAAAQAIRESTGSPGADAEDQDEILEFAPEEDGVLEFAPDESEG